MNIDLPTTPLLNFLYDCEKRLSQIKVLSHDDIKEIVLYQQQLGRGHFLSAIFEAYIRADLENARLMYPLICQLIDKYHLTKGRR